MVLLLYTGVRRSDVVKLGRQNIRGNVIYLRARKTGVSLAIPVNPTLQSHPADLTNGFRDCCVESELETGLSLHRLRKAIGRCVAEAGARTLQIMAVTGHRNVAEIATYVRAASQ